MTVSSIHCYITTSVSNLFSLSIIYTDISSHTACPSPDKMAHELDWKILEDIITTFQPGLPSCDTLKTILTSDSDETCHFFQNSFPAMIKLALRMPEVSFTREQIACLLVHMFFCTIQPAKWNKFWVNFHIWYSSPSKPVLAYLQSLLAYFRQLNGSGVPPAAHDLVSFKRCVLTAEPEWKSSTVKITPSQSLELMRNCEVQFANKDVGFGVCGTQEEAKLAQSPETCIVMLFLPTLQKHEALLIHGPRKIAKFCGVGNDLMFAETYPTHSSLWESRTIVAIDALELDEVPDDSEHRRHLIHELSKNVLERENSERHFVDFPLPPVE